LKRVSVIVSTYSTDRLSYVLSCIASLKKQSLLPHEVILVLDPDEDLVKFYKSHIPEDVRIIISDGYGLSNARNAGVKASRGEIIAFIDDDAVADRDWLKNLVKNYDDPYVIGAGGLIKPVWKGGRPSWFPEELDWIVGCSYKGLPECRCIVRNPIGCNMSFLRDVFEKVGYFNAEVGRIGKKLLASEETDFSLRALRKIPDSKIIHDPSVIVYHRVPRGRANLRYLMRRSFYEGYSKALIVKYGSKQSCSLSTENRYLKYLLRDALPSRLIRFFEFKSLSQLLTLLLSTFLVFIGYIYGRTISRVQ